MQTRVVALAVAVLLVAGVAGVAVHQGPRRAAPVVVAGATTTSSTTALPPALAALITDLEHYVERTRGLTFQRPVPVTLLSEKEFKKRIDAQSQIDKATADKNTRVLRALDLVPAGTDLAKSQKSLLSAAVAGFYDIKAKQLVVRGAKPTPAVRQVLVHELTHAVQDQHFNLDRSDLSKKDDESDQAWTGLVEGDAVRVQDAYVASMSAKDQAAVSAEESDQAQQISPDIPQILLQLLGFPYQVGPGFTKAVLAAGGQARLDAAFASPPSTSEQLIHPDKYLAGEGAIPVADPPANGKVIDRGVFGEFGFILQLEGTPGLTEDAVLRAAAGWGGDRYVAWDEASRTCVRVDTRMDTPRDLDELRAALAKWVARHPGSTLTGGASADSPLRFTSCA
ncbi:MAG TPA: DUF6782 family putative metallopeptidase [Acidimicrobiales bacterium]|nr:DUF6782 family putative metallopeptidase [Acidimicrobiales bacterium]